MLCYGFDITLIRIILSRVFWRFRREKRRTVIKENNNIFVISEKRE